MSVCTRWLVLLVAYAAVLTSPVSAQDTPSEGFLNEGYRALQAGDSLEAARSFQRAVQAAPSEPRPRLELGFLLSALGRRDEAVSELERAAELDPGSAPYGDIGYLNLSLGRDERAAAAFERVLEGEPQNAQVALQLAYIYDQLGRADAADALFAYVATLPDPILAGQARAELAVRSTRLRRGNVVADVYAAPLYQSRFEYAVLPSVGRVGYVLDPEISAQVYAVGRITTDTRSTGGLQPQIFNDNALAVGVGLRAQPSVLGGAAVYGEVGVATSLVDNPTIEDGLDVRAGIYDFRRWGALERTGTFAEVYYDASYYSRYDNAIAYAQARPGVRVLEGRNGSLDVYAALGAVADTRRFRFNNLVEAGPGVRWTLPAQTGLQVRLEYVNGRQFGIGGQEALDYDDARAFLIYNRSFRLD